jgi:hypothetical protein
MSGARMFWRYPEQREITEDVVSHNPRRTGEGIIEYAERIAVLAGLMPVGAAVYASNKRLGRADAPEPVESMKGGRA